MQVGKCYNRHAAETPLYRLMLLSFEQSIREVTRAHSRLLEVTQKQPGQVLLKSAVTVEVRGEKRPALFAEWLTLVVTE